MLKALSSSLMLQDTRSSKAIYDVKKKKKLNFV